VTSTEAVRPRPILNGASPTFTLDTSTPVLLLGGADNSVSICRHLGRRGITIKVSGNLNTCWGLHSRYCREQFLIPHGMEPRDYWTKLLLSPGDASLRGHVVFACNDEGVEFLAKNRDRMLERYLIPDFTPELQLALLDKQKTLELARSVGVPTPQFWNIKTIDDVKRIRSEVMFPVMVKPIHSHRFQRVFNKKLFVIKDSFDELVAKADEALRNDLEIMVVEMIPGPDSLLCSQFSYFDANGDELYNYTKRVIRRYPVNAGPACYHITEWIPEVNDLARKLLKGINFRGLANPEFKRDTRDGKLKVIEVNIRFTAVHELLVHSGLPLDLMVYCHLTQQPLPEFKSYAQFMRMWEPVRDFRAYRQLASRGELTFTGWLRSIMHPKIFPVFRWSDPWPSLVSTAIIVRGQIRKLFRNTK
jgi:predicted ATP-grasp superfamily ATP-dependent carboligase